MTPPAERRCVVMGVASSGQSVASDVAAPEQSRCVPGDPAGACAKLTAAEANQQDHAVDLGQEQSPVGTAPLHLHVADGTNLA
jgi:hypothetical protein